MKIPYGIADYSVIRRENYYYVDKTPYLKAVEDAGKFLFFIRPRRFGKSLFLSMMEAYYDVAHEERFEEFFKGTWIYDHPTGERNKYLVLYFSFSGVDPEPGEMKSSFLAHVRRTAVEFLGKYDKRLSRNKQIDYYSRAIKENSSASGILSELQMLCKGANQRLFVIIDEYDNFSNTILTMEGKDAYHDLTRGTGFFRSFFNVLKNGTAQVDSPVARTFITGVSPITMDDVTSGYNIGENISLDPAFNQMLGFTYAEVEEMLSVCKSEGLIRHEPRALLELMSQWYGNYFFSRHGSVQGFNGETRQSLFNTGMVLHFLKEYFKVNTIPGDLIDRNVRIDYEKLRHLIIAQKHKKATTNGNFSRLKEILEKNETTAIIQKGFPYEKLTDENNFISLLYYFGLLSIARNELNEQVLAIPNEAVKRLYFDYIREGYEETDVFSLDLVKYTRLMKGLALRGEWEPLFDYLTGLMKESMALRDLITGEKALQAFLAVYLGLSDLYIVHGEKELNKGFADIVMEPFLAGYGEIAYSCLIEIKYLKTSTTQKDPELQQLIQDATRQLERYSLDKRFQKTIWKTKLIKLVLVFSGVQMVYSGKVD